MGLIKNLRRRIIKRLASDRARKVIDSLQAENKELRTEIAQFEATLRVAQHENQSLWDLVQRDRRRIESEATAYERTIADNQTPRG